MIAKRLKLWLPHTLKITEINFGGLDLKQSIPDYSLLKHASTCWGFVVPKSDSLYLKLKELQDQTLFIPDHYLRPRCSDPAVILKEVFLLEAATFDFGDKILISTYYLKLALRYFKFIPKHQSLHDTVFRDWGLIFIELHQLDRKKWHRKADELCVKKLGLQDEPYLDRSWLEPVETFEGCL